MMPIIVEKGKSCMTIIESTTSEICHCSLETEYMMCCIYSMTSKIDKITLYHCMFFITSMEMYIQFDKSEWQCCFFSEGSLKGF